MRKYDEITRFLVGKQPAHLSYPLAHLQPVHAKPGEANVDMAKLRKMLEGISLLEYDEPDFWRWAARDILRTLSVDVHLVRSNREGIVLLKGLALKRFLSGSRLVVFGEQNFPWNAHAVSDRVTRQLGT